MTILSHYNILQITVVYVSFSKCIYNHTIFVFSIFSAFLPQSLHNNNLAIFVFVIFAKVEGPNVQKLLCHGVQCTPNGEIAVKFCKLCI